MKTKILFTVLVLILIQLTISSENLIAQDHVVLNTFNVNIRTGPGTDHFIVCTAGKSEIFKLVNEKGDWLEIEMYSGDNRFVHRDLVYFLDEFIPGHRMTLPESEEKSKKIFLDLKWAETAAKKEAEEIIPVNVDKARNENFRKVMRDKNIHTIFEIHGFQSALYPELMTLAKKKKW
ncbi:MAG: SH3 domain-containing protein [Bacteroidetes bacterium]|nr:SH3 domain-containing protein [Bacteroidota bacterium]MBL7105208.1 SH3 domain-containing protein [Bacteroidales bacterium]